MALEFCHKPLPKELLSQKDHGCRAQPPFDARAVQRVEPKLAVWIELRLCALSLQPQRSS